MNEELNRQSYPLSPMQQGMLFHHLSAREPGVDIEQILCTLPEAMDVRSFERAWQSVVDRQDILRTTFHWEGLAEPRQTVQPRTVIDFQFDDWREKSPADQAECFESVLDSDRRRGFQLSAAPPLRVALFQFGEERYRLLLTFHHLLLDGRALVMVLNEVFAFYEALIRGEDLELLELQPAYPYRTYIEWLQQQDPAAAEKFWRKTLKGFAAPTPLGGVSNAEDAVQDGGSNRGEQEIRLSEAVTTTLKSLARKNGFTPNTILQGVWAMLLSRYGRETDVVFGAIRAGRRSNLPFAGATVGLFINTVALRVPVQPDLPVMTWLNNVREAWTALRDFEHTALVNVQGWSDVPRGQPLFETIFNFQDPSWDAALQAQGGKWSKRELGIRSQSNYPLVVDAYGGHAFRIKILYHRNRFDDASIGRMLEHFKTLLEGIATCPEEQVANLPMLTEAERQQLLVDWNGREAGFPRDKCVQELFAEQVRRTPDGLAVSDGKQQLSYRELDARAGQLAQQLCQLGAGPDMCVGVCLERSVEMVVALLAVWQAGAIQVPLDPASPGERLRFMIENAGMPILIAQQSVRAKLQPEIPGLAVVCVDDETQGLVAGKVERKNQGLRVHRRSSREVQRSSSLAYVIYTSGSTGTPKGVEIEHRSLVNLIAWHQQTYHITPADRATQIAAPAFDASVWELWPYLAAGASIHIPDETTRLAPERLQSWLAASQITMTFIPTPILEKMLDGPWPEDGRLRAVLTGGDKLHRAPGSEFPCALMNHYGPTENTVVTTWTSVSPAGRKAQPPPIGRPLPNVQVFILDSHLQPVPVGVAGELHIGGENLARGYWRRPDLTAEKFIPNPFGKHPGARLYKTGDLVRWRSDGQIEFLGRMDHQVKVRGNRIELGEIEAALLLHPAVREAAAVVRAAESGEDRLVAYLVPPADAQTNQKPEAGGLRDFLREKLPDYMVPSAVVFLDALPLTPNGKLDRAALPDPKREAETEFVAPRTAAEQTLAKIWSEVLGVKQIGVMDNFFALGGHSLTIAQVAMRLSVAFQVQLPLADLFAAPTLAGLAQKIECACAARQAGNGALLSPPVYRPPLVHVALDGRVPLSFAQERIWFMEQMEPGVPFNNIPVAFRVDGPLDAGALQHALNEMVRRHAVFRTVFGADHGRPVARVEPAQSFAVPLIDLSLLPPESRVAEARRFAGEEARRPFDLALGALLRAKLLRFSAEEHWLLLTTHHIACDGWSLGIFNRELGLLYKSFAQGQAPPPMTEVPVSYADFARWQREWLQDGVLTGQLDFWRQELKNAPANLDLPADQPRPPVQTYRGDVNYFTLPCRLTSALELLAQREGVTPFMLLLAAFQTLLCRYSGQTDLFVGSPVAGRPSVETEQVVGLFLNTVVLRGDLAGDPTFRELLQRVRKTALDAYAHQDLPFEKLVDALPSLQDPASEDRQLERDLSRSPLFQVMFVLQNEPLPPLQLAGLKLTPLPVHSGTAKFDLMLSLEKNAGAGGGEAGGLSGFIEYNADLFQAETIARMAGHFQMLLESAALDAEQHVSQLPLLTEPERKQICSDWNDTRTVFPDDKCIDQLIEEQVRQTPDAVALVFGQQQLTYRELDEQATGLARQLQACGVGPEVCVGVCLERSLEMVVGLFAILKAGGAYVPLDPMYPCERVSFMLRDSQAKVLLTQEPLQRRFQFETSKLKVLFPKDLHHHFETDFKPCPRDSGNLAYVIYTSGSTGAPKGVMVTHRNVVNFFAGMDRLLGKTPGVWLAVTSICFDISVLELFWTLARGFKVVIQPDDHRAASAMAANGNGQTNGQGRSLPEQILRHGVTHLQCTPSLAGTLVLAPESQAAMRSLDNLLLGGEALPVSLAAKLRELLRGRLFNLYGPTETTVWSAAHLVSESGNSIPIGRPIANTRIYLLDKHLSPVPAGVTGEIYIGGEGVARGYLNRPELAAEKFIPSPFGAEAGARLYRTGDLGRWLGDGTIEFLGRVDHQVKIRGHRIEPGEIESALTTHPAVREAVVVAREEAPGEKRLVAYLVSQSNIDAGRLRRFLQERLPAAMIPSAFIFLDRMPLTPNGKVDRRALPAPESNRPVLEATYVAPQTAMENGIAEIWRELLHVDQVGLHDNFFDLGGHSLLVVQMQALLRDRLGCQLPVVKLFQYPTVRSLANYLNQPAPALPADTGSRGRRKQATLARQPRPEEIPA